MERSIILAITTLTRKGILLLLRSTTGLFVIDLLRTAQIATETIGTIEVQATTSLFRKGECLEEIGARVVAEARAGVAVEVMATAATMPPETTATTTARLQTTAGLETTAMTTARLETTATRARKQLQRQKKLQWLWIWQLRRRRLR